MRRASLTRAAKKLDKQLRKKAVYLLDGDDLSHFIKELELSLSLLNRDPV